MLIQKGGAVYIITNKRHTVLYTGVTSDLYKRIKQHKEKVYQKSFTAGYNWDKLVWFYIYPQIEEAIAREKQIKAGSRDKKMNLINALNPEWKDLWETEVKFW